MIYILHISDLHMFKDPNNENMVAAIKYNVEETITKEKDNITGILLVVTGDFHQYSVPGYNLAKSFLDSLIEMMGLERNRDVFLIPGNHDVSPSAKNDLFRNNAIKLINNKHNEFYGGNCDALQSKQYYQEYLEFVNEMGIYSNDDVASGLPIRTHLRTWNNKLHLLHLNTTLVAKGDSKTNQCTDTEAATRIASGEILSQGKCSSLCLGHNSFYDMHENQRNQLAGAFANGYISAYLSGDRHYRVKNREEKSIPIGENLGSIPNVVCYRSSTDEDDDYSDFGMMWHLIDERKWKATVRYFRWDKNDQARLHSDGETSYDIRHNTTSDALPYNYKGENQLHHWIDESKIRELSKRELMQKHINSFLLGRNSGRTYWNLIASKRIVQREIVSTLLDSIDSSGIYVLMSAGGEGKTTALMQLAIVLINKGKNVFFSTGYKSLPFPDPVRIQNGSFFLLDNVLSESKFLDLLEEMRNLTEEKDVSFVLAARENEWNLMEKNTPDYLSYFSGLVQKVYMGTVTVKESKQFAKCIKRNLRTSKDTNQIIKIFKDNSYGFLYASMLLSVSEKNTLDEIACDIIRNLRRKSLEALSILAFVVISENCGAEINQVLFKKLCKQHNLSERYTCYILSQELVNNAGNYQTRHPVISKLFYREVLECLSQDELDAVIQNLVLLRSELYNQLIGSSRWSYWKGIKSIIQTVSLASSETQEYIIQRLLDDTKVYSPTDFSVLYDKIGDRTSQNIFIRLCYDRNRLNAGNLKSWTLRELQNQPWDYEIPYSAAWIYKSTFEKSVAENQFILDWIAIEKQKRGLGNFSQENSVRWIFRNACMEHDVASHIWLAWCRLEVENGNIGDYDIENSARWIFREACMRGDDDGQVWLAWGKLEVEYGNIGNYDIENSARWIFRKACMEHNDDGQVWLAWGRLEAEDGNIGDYNVENSARWIFRKACMEYDTDYQTWLAWGRLETEYGNIGDPEIENSARWIFRKACMEHNATSEVWLAWGRLETEYGNIGDYDIENSARWIFRKASMEHSEDGQVWLAWGRLEVEVGNVGDYNVENSARWIFREACIRYHVDGKVWIDWANLEVAKENIGNYELENSAMWILITGIQNSVNDSRLYTSLTKIELSNGSVENARHILEMAYLKHVSACGLLAILMIICGRCDSSIILEDLLTILGNKKDSSWGAIIYLYHCYMLLGKPSLAKKVLERLHSRFKVKDLAEQKSNNSINDYITLCHLAKEGKTITDTNRNIDSLLVEEEFVN